MRVSVRDATYTTAEDFCNAMEAMKIRRVAWGQRGRRRQALLRYARELEGDGAVLTPAAVGKQQSGPVRWRWVLGGRNQAVEAVLRRLQQDSNLRPPV